MRFRGVRSVEQKEQKKNRIPTYPKKKEEETRQERLKSALYLGLKKIDPTPPPQ